MTPDAAHIAQRLNKSKRQGSGWIACCPAHEDRTPSLSINDGDKGPVFHCHAGCTQESVLTAIEALGVTIRKVNGNGMNGHSHGHATNDLPLLTVESLASAKRLDVRELSTNYVYDSDRGVAFDYTDRANNAVGTKYRRYLGGGADRGFSWSQGSKPCLYGLWRLDKDYANDGRIILCEGETDCLTLWQHGFTALGLPGASMWKDEWANEIPEGARVYVILEPDQGGRTVEAAIEKSPLRSKAFFIRMTEAAKDPNALHLSRQAFVEDFEKLIAGAAAVEKPKPQRIVFRDISELLADESETEWLLEDTLERGAIALMVGARGSLKSFIAIDWAMRCAIEGHGAIVLSAEGNGFGRRIQAWRNTFAPKVEADGFKLKSFDRSVSLCVPDVLAELQERMEAVPWAPELLVIDTLSKYSAGLDENENSEVRDFLESLSESLRNVFGCAILMVAHTGYIASDRIRGASSFGANTDSEFIVTRQSPTELVCKVSRERFKDSPALDPIGYQGEVIDLGRTDKKGRAVTSLILRAGADLAPPKVRGAGANQTAALVALREWVVAHKGHPVIPHDELAALLKRQGITAKRKPEVLNWLVNAGAILPSVGGHKVNAEAIL